ncbi:MAG: aminopeptidase P N-terminal domain-containing protein [Polyangiaceae bacterium]|nr:aminopeptidase P N-terminal domain-containing protein [Polyangiaceae bacterium]
MPIDKSLYAARRREVLSRMGGGVLVVPSTPVYIRNNDVEHAYRQDSDLYYLTGFDEPETVLVLREREGRPEAIFFVRPKNAEREIWDGYRAGVEGAVAEYGASVAHSIEDLERLLPDLLENTRRLFYRLGLYTTFDSRVLRAIDVVRSRARRGVYAPTEIVDPGTIVHELRLRKDEQELALMRRAAEITGHAHRAAMEAALPGRYEYEVEAEIERAFRAGGSRRPAYESIVGSGPNATVLHYRSNSRRMEDGDLLLIDAGCEYGYYASDVTRTFPVGGRFTEAQRALYEIVLRSQKEAIAAVRPGITMDDVHDVALRVLVEGLIELGLLEGSSSARIEDGGYRAYYMHRTSHFLGMDVHDVGSYFVDGAKRLLEPGMILTVEPGLYVGEHSEAPEAFRGNGIRIEDDIVVTETGYENLTAHIPKEADELETILGARPRVRAT